LDDSPCSSEEQDDLVSKVGVDLRVANQELHETGGTHPAKRSIQQFSLPPAQPLDGRIALESTLNELNDRGNVSTDCLLIGAMLYIREQQGQYLELVELVVALPTTRH